MKVEFKSPSTTITEIIILITKMMQRFLNKAIQKGSLQECITRIRKRNHLDLKCCILSRSEVVDLIDGRSRDGVEDESDEQDEQQKQQQFDDEPLVIAPYNVAHRFERIHEPQEGVVWSAAMIVGK